MIENLINDVFTEILVYLDVIDIMNLSLSSTQLHKKIQNNLELIETKRYLKYAGGYRMLIDSDEKIDLMLSNLGLESHHFNWATVNQQGIIGKLKTNILTWNNTIIPKDIILEINNVLNSNNYIWDRKLNKIDIKINNSLIRIDCKDNTFMVSPYLNHKIPINQTDILKNLVQYYCIDDIEKYGQGNGGYTTWLHVNHERLSYQIPIEKCTNLPFEFNSKDKILNITCETDDKKIIYVYFKSESEFLTGYYHVKNSFIYLDDIILMVSDE